MKTLLSFLLLSVASFANSPCHMELTRVVMTELPIIESKIIDLTQKMENAEAQDNFVLAGKYLREMKDLYLEISKASQKFCASSETLSVSECSMDLNSKYLSKLSVVDNKLMSLVIGVDEAEAEGNFSLAESLVDESMKLVRSISTVSYNFCSK